jgi:glycosyltransferase involved in cell wall biosynthesis
MRARRAPRVAAVIPAYNEAATIAAIARRTGAHVDEVIVVDDGSCDATAAALAGVDVTLIRHERNLGKGASLADGIAQALRGGADAVVTLDADGQHVPDEIPRLVRAWLAHPGDVIVGARLRHAERAPRLRKAANRLGDFWIGWAAGQAIDDSQSGFRLYPSALLRRLAVPRRPGRGFVFESEMLIEAGRAGARIRSVAIDAIYGGAARPSHFRPVADFAAIARMVAVKLFSRGMHPAGLCRMLADRASPRVAETEEGISKQASRQRGKPL